MNIPEILPHEAAKEYALRVLKKNIITLELQPGSQISENELSSALSLSRTPIREALAELAKVKLIEIVPQKRTSISLIDYDLVEEASFMRYPMESAVIERVCQLRTEQDLICLEENIALQKVYFQNGLKDRLFEKDNEFHRAFFEMTHNLEIFQLMQNLEVHFDRVRSLFVNNIQELGIVEEHEAIVQGIKNRDAAYTKAQLQAHLNRYKVDATELQRRFPDYFRAESAL